MPGGPGPTGGAAGSVLHEQPQDHLRREDASGCPRVPGRDYLQRERLQVRVASLAFSCFFLYIKKKQETLNSRNKS